MSKSAKSLRVVVLVAAALMLDNGAVTAEVEQVPAWASAEARASRPPPGCPRTLA